MPSVELPTWRLAHKYIDQGCQTHFGVGPHWMKCDFMGAGAMQPVAGCKHAHHDARM